MGSYRKATTIVLGQWFTHFKQHSSSNWCCRAFVGSSILGCGCGQIFVVFVGWLGFGGSTVSIATGKSGRFWLPPNMSTEPCVLAGRLGFCSAWSPTNYSMQVFIHATYLVWNKLPGWTHKWCCQFCAIWESPLKLALVLNQHDARLTRMSSRSLSGQSLSSYNARVLNCTADSKLNHEITSTDPSE